MKQVIFLIITPTNFNILEMAAACIDGFPAAGHSL